MPKYADPAVYPVTAPAADDTAMARTNAGGDRNFLLGNLAGLAPLPIANDQAPYFGAGAWGSYSLTAVGRTLLAANTQAAQRTALGLGDAAVQNIGISGATVPLLNGDNTWAERQTFLNQMVFSFTGNAMSLASNSRVAWRGGTKSPGLRGVNGIMVVAADADTVLLRPGGDLSMVGQVSISTAGALLPNTTNTQDVGSSSLRWTSIFLVNAPNVSSDSRLKTEPRQLRDAEFKAASAIARLPAVWRWIHRVHGDENCEPEGRDARKHFGPTVQAAIAVMEAHGLDPFAYSFICYDEWEAQPEQWHEWPNELDDDGNVIREAGRELLQPAREAGDRYSFRKEELLCFLVAAMARQHDELAERVAALEAKLTP